MDDYRLIELDETESTNKYLYEMLNADDACVYDLTTVVAEYQTGGRGQRGNTWESNKGENLLFSMTLLPDFVKAKDGFIVSQAVALSMQQELSRVGKGCIRIKWPNDIYWNDRKLAGILIENGLRGQNIRYSIVGIGLNVNQTKFSDALPNPVSMAQIAGHPFDRKLELHWILRRIMENYENLLDGHRAYIREEYDKVLYRRDGFYRYRDANGEFVAELVNVENDGHLCLRDTDGNIRRYAFKEVEYVIEPKKIWENE
jgi:BirA family biotin operon repressor/biotin-[acetyl-CoA-carboxylase] ligase